MQHCFTFSNVHYILLGQNMSVRSELALDVYKIVHYNSHFIHQLNLPDMHGLLLKQVWQQKVYESRSNGHKTMYPFRFRDWAQYGNLYGLRMQIATPTQALKLRLHKSLMRNPGRQD